MVDLIVSIKRPPFTFQNGFDLKNVQRWKDELTKFLSSFTSDGRNYKYYLFYSEKLYEQILHGVQQELKLCDFYIDYQQRRTEPNFGTWVLLRKGTINKYDRIREYDQWTKTNGRIRATITVDDDGKMTKLTLSFENDNKHLEFFSHYDDDTKPQSVHAKNELTIQAKRKELMETAEKLMAEKRLPKAWEFDRSSVRHTFEEIEQYQFFEEFLCLKAEKQSQEDLNWKNKLSNVQAMHERQEQAAKPLLPSNKQPLLTST